MPRTTLMIDAAILKELKARAAREGRTMQAVANDLLRKSLHSLDRPEYSLQLKGWKAEEQPGVDILDRDKLFDVMSGR